MKGIVTLLRVGAVAALVLGVLGALLPGDAGTVAATGAVAVVVTTPLARVGWLSVRWARLHDRRFAALAAVLLVVIAAGTAIGLAA